MNHTLINRVRNSAPTGRIWLCGEMEFDCNEGAAVAYKQAVVVAEACGYLVEWRYGHSAFSITGSEIIGYVVFDWFSPQGKELVKVEFWSSEDVWIKSPSQDSSI